MENILNPVNVHLIINIHDGHKTFSLEVRDKSGICKTFPVKRSSDIPILCSVKCTLDQLNIKNGWRLRLPDYVMPKFIKRY